MPICYPCSLDCSKVNSCWCGSSCSDRCTWCNSKGNCMGSCDSSCDGGCDGGCYNSCYGSCDGSCDGSCYGGCYGNCYGSCNTTCTGKCKGSCNTTCTGNCKGSCNTTCTGNCKGNCKGSCNNKCNTGCTSTTSVSLYNKLPASLSEIMKQSEIQAISDVLIAEAARRGVSVTKQTFTVGNIITSAQMAFLNTAAKAYRTPSNSATQYNKTLKAHGNELLQIAKDAYNQSLPG